jgi:mannose-1-phosphate guanylyltransferase
MLDDAVERPSEVCHGEDAFMIQSEPTCGTPLPSIHPIHQDEGDPWAVVLAGGEGVRLRPLIRQLYGEERPKQYAVLTGSKSLLRQTLDRVALLIPPRRTVVVTRASHIRYLTKELAECPEVHVLPQPSDRGTAGAVLLAAHWLCLRDPQATVVVFPADHFIREEALFMRHVAEMATYVGAHPEWLVLSGARPTEPEADYGWIEPGERVGWTGRCPLYRVRGFREKPTKELARNLFMSGGLWNTFVFATSVATLIVAGQECLPLLHDRLVRLGVFVGTQYESWALRQAYLFAPTADFSRTVLGSSSLPLAVALAPALMWCDLGTPERVARTLRTLGTSPAWLATVESRA